MHIDSRVMPKMIAFPPSPFQRAHFLEEDRELEGAHESAASGGDTEVRQDCLFFVGQNSSSSRNLRIALSE
jgi:hypothetical protein